MMTIDDDDDRNRFLQMKGLCNTSSQVSWKMIIIIIL
jgi:hypothetical protein